MEAQRLLSRLNTISVNWEISERVTGDVLRAEDIAYSLAGLARGPYLLMRYLWCQDESVKQELYGLLLMETVHIADRNNWKCKNDFSRLMAFIKTAIHEIQFDNICKSCKGTGIKCIQKCMSCNGSGKKRRSQSELSHSCGIKPSNWKKQGEMKFNNVYTHLMQWNDIGVEHMLSRLCA